MNGNFFHGASMPRVRVPLQGTLWAGGFFVDTSGDIPMVMPGPFASQAFNLNPEDSLDPVFQEPVRAWVDLPLSVQDGAGNPYSSGLRITPLHAPQGWTYTGTSYGFPAYSDTTGNTTLNLPQGESLRIEIAPPGGCGLYWYGYVDLTIPTPVPLDPIQLKATSQKGTACPGN
jgi:hypothetical protein